MQNSSLPLYAQSPQSVSGSEEWNMHVWGLGLLWVLDFVIKESEFSSKWKALVLKNYIEKEREKRIPRASKCQMKFQGLSVSPECKMIKQKEGKS